jgi:AraC-like DNA-binding protein
VLTITLIFSAFTIASLITHLFFPPRGAWLYLSLNALLVYAVMSLLLFFKPWILYGSKPKMPTESQRTKRNIRTVIPENISTDLEERMKIYIANKLYLRRNITIKDVAAELAVQQYILSAFINQQYDMHFNDLINYHRVQYIREGLMNGEWEMLTLEAIAHKAGFNNRTTFINAFKKFTGMVPSEYMSKVKRNDEPTGSNEQVSPI